MDKYLFIKQLQIQLRGLLLLPLLLKLARAGSQLINRYIQWNARLVKEGAL